MRICIASDHAALTLKAALVQFLSEAGHEVHDQGPHDETSVDYPDYAEKVSRCVAKGGAERGILVCGTGIGMSIAANKVPGVRAALVHDPFTARLAAAHNHANVLCLGGRMLAPAYGCELVATWLDTPFEPRHLRRLDKITRLEHATPGEPAQ